MRAAPLPGRIRWDLADSVLDAQVRVAGDRVDLIKTPGLEVPKETRLGGHRLCGGDLHTE